MLYNAREVISLTAKKISRGNFSAYVKKYIQLCIGAVIAAVGLELFLIPNEVIDGGVEGGVKNQLAMRNEQ